MLKNNSTKVVPKKSFNRRRELNLAAPQSKSTKQQYREFLAALYKNQKSKKRKKKALTGLVGVFVITIFSLTLYFSSSGDLARAEKVLGEKEVLEKLEPKIPSEQGNSLNQIILPPR